MGQSCSSPIPLLLLLCWHSHRPECSLEAGGDYRFCSLNWVTVGKFSKYQRQPSAWRWNARSEGWGSSLDRCWLNILACIVKPAPCVICISALQVWPTNNAWKSCSELGRTTWLLINPGQRDWWLHSLSMFSCGSSHRVARQALLSMEVRGGSLGYFSKTS